MPLRENQSMDASQEKSRQWVSMDASLRKPDNGCRMEGGGVNGCLSKKTRQWVWGGGQWMSIRENQAIGVGWGSMDVSVMKCVSQRKPGMGV